MSDETDLNELTDMDAVVGMLVRHDFAILAKDLAQGVAAASEVAEILRGKSHLFVAPLPRAACAAACEALARGELRVARDHRDLLAAIERLRARDAAWQRATQCIDPDAFPVAVCGGTTNEPAPRAQWVSRAARLQSATDVHPSREPNDAGGGP